MKKYIFLFTLIPSSCFADRLGSLKSNADVLLTTQTATVSNTVNISTDSSIIQTGGFSVSTGSFSASQDEMVSVRRQNAAGSNKNALIGFYSNPGGTDILKNQFGYFNTNGTGFGLVDGSSIFQWKMARGFVPDRLSMRLYNVSGSNYVSFRSSDTTDNQEYVLPSSTGTVGQVLGIGAIIPATGGNEGITTLSWQTASGSSGINNQNTLQSGATFYVSSGTIKGQFSAIADVGTSTPIIVQGAVSQSGDLQDWKKNDGTILDFVNKSGTFQINSSSFSDPSLILGGVGCCGSVDNIDGLYLRVGFNSTANRQLWIGDSGRLNNNAYSSFRYILGFPIPLIDAISNDGTTHRNVGIAAEDSNVGIGLSISTLVQADIVAKLHVFAEALKVGLIVMGAPSQSSDLLQFRNSSSSVLSAFSFNGAFLPATLSDSAAPNSSLFICSDHANKLCFKDAGGTVNQLY